MGQLVGITNGRFNKHNKSADYSNVTKQTADFKRQQRSWLFTETRLCTAPYTRRSEAKRTVV